MPSFEEYKSIFSSKTFWGAVIMLLGFFVPKLADLNVQTQWVDQITMVIGFVLTLVGRFTATKAVSLTGQK